MLNGKTALVTGSTSGIGLGIATALAADGANVVLNGFGDADAIEKTRAGLASTHGVEVLHSAADMTKPDQIAVMIAEAEARFGAVDILVNAICPGYVWTPLVEKQIPDTAKARGMSEEQVKRDVILAAQPTKEFVTVEEIGALAVFLCGDAAKGITGAMLPVDGGWTAA